MPFHNRPRPLGTRLRKSPLAPDLFSREHVGSAGDNIRPAGDNDRTHVPFLLQTRWCPNAGGRSKTAMTAAAEHRLNGGMATAVAPAADTALVPPQNLDAEESVLGAMLLSPGAISAVTEILDAGQFYRESHAKVFRACIHLFASGEPVDAITVADELEERGELDAVGGRVR